MATKTTLTKVERYYYEMRIHLHKHIEVPGLTLGSAYWADDENLPLYHKLRKFVKAKQRFTETSKKLLVYTEEKYSEETKINTLILEYIERRISILKAR